jgi:2-polyprenyl-3-methyl-5-hydroxy-6-metoxy-1,4-benzoquinol methylase
MELKENVGTAQLFELGMGFMSSKMLFVANEIGVFPALANGSADLDSLSRQLDVPRRTLRMVVDAMVALSLLELDDDGRYRNGPAAAALLAGDGPADARPMLRFWDQISYHAWSDLERVVRTDSPPVLHELDAERQKVFSEGIAAATAAAAATICAVYDFADHSRVLDVGGGTGSILAMVLADNPHLQGTLVDAPEVTEIARTQLAQTEVADRVSVVSAHLLSDALPTDHDVVLLSHVIHYFRPEGNVKLLEQIRAAVEPGAKLVILDFWTNATHTAPLTAVLMAGQFLTSMHGDAFSEEEMTSWLEQSGWRYVESVGLSGLADSLIIAQAV